VVSSVVAPSAKMASISYAVRLATFAAAWAGSYVAAASCKAAVIFATVPYPKSIAAYLTSVPCGNTASKVPFAKACLYYSVKIA
jgi:hypothetical protein